MKYSLGLELGSTRIKAVLIDEKFNIVSSGDFIWENKLINGYWTYSLDEVEKGVKSSIRSLFNDYKNKYKKELTHIDSMGVSAMMHGYLAFDKNDNLLVPFRTWRNTTTGEAADKLTKLFNFNIPQRWSIAHLYQAILNKEKHISKISYITTLAGYIHYVLTGEHSVGIGEASGIFPIDSKKNNYDLEMINKFNKLIKGKVNFKLEDVLPKVKLAGEEAGTITKEGMKFLGISIKDTIKMCPCEGDAGTGMVATNSIKNNTGNVSAGTSDFAMIVTNKKLGVHQEIDMVTTPVGLPVAMVHCNNCTGDINAWVNLIHEAITLTGNKIDKGELFSKLFKESLKGDKEVKGLMSFNYYSGEGVTFLDKGKLLLTRDPDANFSLANFMKLHLMSSLATLKIGLDILTKKENIKIEKIYGHGGLFKTPRVGQELLSAAIAAPVSLLSSAGEGGPYGMALLASYLINKDKKENLEDYLSNKVFKKAKVVTINAKKEDVDGFNKFITRYKKYIQLEKEAIKY